MIAFAIQKHIDSKIWIMMQMHCKHSNPSDCQKQCHSSDIKVKLPFSNSSFQKKIIKIKIFSFVNILENNSSKFLENKNLIKNTSPPNLQKSIKYYSYSDLIKIIKSNT